MKYIDLLENYVDLSTSNLWTTPETVDRLQKYLTSLSTKEFSSLIMISGYIPDHYDHDSSEETLYSKLIELLVYEWAKRIGFDLSELPTQKSSIEDITIQDNDYVIVSDAKSFRLGRSQKSPNVKDTIKSGDYKKWLDRHKSKHQLGGILTFPEMFEWVRSSDVHSYLTNKENRILLLYYSHLSACLELGINKIKFIEYFQNFESYFPRVINKDEDPKSIYFNNLYATLFSGNENEVKDFLIQSSTINLKIKDYALQRIEKIIKERSDSLKSVVDSFDTLEGLKSYVVQEILPNHTEELIRIKNNIIKFR